MADTTLDEARRCPRCQEPGRPNGVRPAPERYLGELHSFMCMNNRCRWYQTPWTVQVRPDGTVPPPVMDREKNFPKLSPNSLKERIAQVRSNLDEEIRRERERGGGEF